MHEFPALSVAFVPGVTITKWTRIWAERHPHTPLTILPTDQVHQVSVVTEGIAQLSFVRLPIDAEGVHVIPLYSEQAVAVAGKDHFISAAESITLDDLAGEKRQVASTKHHDRGPFDLVAAGVGVLVVPQSVARLQSRKDVVVRPITDAPETQIAVIWDARPNADTSEDAVARAEQIAEFIGIVRGRTAQSSRTAPSIDVSVKKGQRSKAQGSARGASKTGGATERGGAVHAANRKRAEARKKYRGR